MNERQPAADVAAEITLWQISALQLPVGDVQSALTAALRGLARQLNDFKAVEKLVTDHGVDPAARLFGMKPAA